MILISGCGLEHSCSSKQRGFTQGRCLQLDADGKFVAIYGHCSSWKRNATDPGDVRIDGVAITEVHGERIVLGTKCKCRPVRRRPKQYVALLEDGVEFVPDQATDLEGPLVVRVVVAGAEHVGSQHDASLDLLTESLGTASSVEVEENLSRFKIRASSVADPVISSEVARGLRGADDVVGGDADIGQWQLDIDDFRSQ